MAFFHRAFGRDRGPGSLAGALPAAAQRPGPAAIVVEPLVLEWLAPGGMLVFGSWLAGMRGACGRCCWRPTPQG